MLLAVVTATAYDAYYAYDDTGRLTAVIDGSGTTAVYSYDAVGNLLGITRYTPSGSGIDIFALLPSKGTVGSQVKLQGYGFDTTPANNTVTFNGTGATVVSATAYALVVTVPSGATTGTVGVSNSNGSATSSETFTMVGSPTISGISPGTVTQGTARAVTISGTNLGSATSVTFSQTGLSATLLTGVTATALPVRIQAASTVPTGTYTFSVVSPQGTIRQSVLRLPAGSCPAV